MAVTRSIRTFAWLVFVTQVLIVATGGIVRLTASGLGCPTWPSCSGDSFVATPEMGIHGIVEFGNRLLFFVLQIIAIIGLILAWKIRKSRREIFWLFLVAALSVFIQAIIGGITVLSGLNPYVVGLHFLASVVLVILAALLVFRSYESAGPRVPTVGSDVRLGAYLVAIATLVLVVLGIMTTGAGPHAGDSGAARNGLNPESIQTAHAVSAYVTLFGTLWLWRKAFVAKAIRMWNFTKLTMLVIVMQIIVGISQARLALPPVLVTLHMVLACLLAAGMTMIVATMWVRARDDRQA